MKLLFSSLSACFEEPLVLAEVERAIVAAGIELESSSQINEDILFDLSFTPNLGRALSVWGTARELAPFLQKRWRGQSSALYPTIARHESPRWSVEVRSTACTHCLLLHLKNVQVRQSPLWLKESLERLGMRSINNLVDLGNWVMLETGQPLHLYDAAAIPSGSLVFENAVTPHTLKTIDLIDRVVPEGSLLVTAAGEPLAIAGVLGGYSSQVNDHSMEILVEAAHFDPSSIRATSKRMGVRSEASYRFERFVDPLLLDVALRRFMQLLLEDCPHASIAGLSEVSSPLSTPKILLSCSRVNDLLGTALTLDWVTCALTELGFVVANKDVDQLIITVPSYRNDVTDEVDLIEEVARMVGLENIVRDPTISCLLGSKHDLRFLTEQKIQGFLISQGFDEWITCSLESVEMAKLGLPLLEGELVAVIEPSSEEYAALRSSLIPAFTRVALFNKARGEHNVRGFELASLVCQKEKEICEIPVLGILWAGNRLQETWVDSGSVTFFDFKAVIEALLAHHGIKGRFEVSHYDFCHPRRQCVIVIDGKEAGWIGELHPHCCSVGSGFYMATLRLEPFMQLDHFLPLAAPALFPRSFRDLTIQVEQEFPYQRIHDCLDNIQEPLLEKYAFLGLYQSEKIGEKKKNLTFRFFYRKRVATISQEEVESAHVAVCSHLQANCPVVIL